MKSNFCQLWLTVGSKAEADKISQKLLDLHLIACARQIPVESDFWWQGKKDNSTEILLLMESSLDLFEKIELQVAKLHSYDTFVLEAVPVTKVSKSAEEWLKSELKHGK